MAVKLPVFVPGVFQEGMFFAYIVIVTALRSVCAGDLLAAADLGTMYWRGFRDVIIR